MMCDVCLQVVPRLCGGSLVVVLMLFGSCLRVFFGCLVVAV